VFPLASWALWLSPGIAAISLCSLDIVSDVAVTIDWTLLREKLLISSEGLAAIKIRCKQVSHGSRANGLSLLYSILLLKKNITLLLQ
jgi:hypothetical protein